MAPFRASRSTRSGRPGGPSDHDIFDGLPVRQWKLQEAIVGPNEEVNGEAAKAAAAQNERSEVPMPKGSELYAPWSLQLLRAARSGKVFKSHDSGTSRTGWNTDEAGSSETRHDETQQRGTKRGAQNGFVATKWTLVPKHLEEPEQVYLAKRRKGLQTTHPGRNGTSATSVDLSHMRRTKVRRPDGDGQPQVLEVMVPEGQTVEGEIGEDSILENVATTISAPAPGTIVHGLGIANEDGIVVATEGVMPMKKRGPIRKKKKKKGGINLSTTGGQGVSASAEAFIEQQRRAQNAMESSGPDNNGTQNDSIMTGTNGEDEEDEEGTDDEDDGEEAEDEGRVTHEVGEVSEMLAGPSEVPEIVLESEESRVPDTKLNLPQGFSEGAPERLEGETSLVEANTIQTPGDGMHRDVDQDQYQDQDQQGPGATESRQYPDEHTGEQNEASEPMEVELQDGIVEKAAEIKELEPAIPLPPQSELVLDEPRPAAQQQPAIPGSLENSSKDGPGDRQEELPVADEEAIPTAAAAVEAVEEEKAPAVAVPISQTQVEDAPPPVENVPLDPPAHNEATPIAKGIEALDEASSNTPTRPSPEPLSPFSPPPTDYNDGGDAASPPPPLPHLPVSALLQEQEQDQPPPRVSSTQENTPPAAAAAPAAPTSRRPSAVMAIETLTAETELPVAAAPPAELGAPAAATEEEPRVEPGEEQQQQQQQQHAPQSSSALDPEVAREGAEQVPVLPEPGHVPAAAELPDSTAAANTATDSESRGLGPADGVDGTNGVTHVPEREGDRLERGLESEGDRQA